MSKYLVFAGQPEIPSRTLKAFADDFDDLEFAKAITVEMSNIDKFELFSIWDESKGEYIFTAKWPGTQ